MSMDDFAFMTAMLLGTPEVMSEVLINGQGPVTAAVMRAEESRIHQYLTTEEWVYPSYEIFFQSSVFGAPYNLNEQAEIQIVATGMKGVVRTLDPPVGAMSILFGYALIVCIPR